MSEGAATDDGAAPLVGLHVEVGGASPSLHVASWFLRNLGAHGNEDTDVRFAADASLEGASRGDLGEIGAGGLPAGTVTYAVGLALASAGLLSVLGQRGAVLTSEVVRHLLLPASFPAPRFSDSRSSGGDRDRSPLPWGDGALACDLRSPEDRETFDRLLTTLNDPESLPDATIAALAQEWRLPVVEYALRQQMRDAAEQPVVSGVGWGTSSHAHDHPPRLSLLLEDPVKGSEAGNGASAPAGLFSGGRALTGVRALDMTSMWAGPLATALLAGAGAEVIKVEPACRLDGMRGTPEMFAALNENKTVVDLDLRREVDRSSFLDLVASSDIVIDNFSPRVMPNLGLTRPVLVGAGGDSLLTLSMPAFPKGSRRSWTAYGTGVHAASGLGDLGDGRFAAPSVSYPDPIAGFTAFATIVALLVGRSLGWRPRHTEVTILGATLPLLRFL